VARWPIHGVPDDLVDVELAGVYPDLARFRLRGRLEGNRLLPYWTRAEIERLGAELPAPVLLWAEDPIELFFLQVQGSGRVELPDGSRIRIGYADQNGHPYVSIGRWLIDQGEMTLAQASMDGIKAWAATHPERLSELLGANPSYVFFRQLPAGEGGPIGALGVPLTDGRSIAVDPRSVPLGAPVYIDATEPNSTHPLRRLVVAQDTGSAIKGQGGADAAGRSSLGAAAGGPRAHPGCTITGSKAPQRCVIRFNCTKPVRLIREFGALIFQVIENKALDFLVRSSLLAPPLCNRRWSWKSSRWAATSCSSCWAPSWCLPCIRDSRFSSSARFGARTRSTRWSRS